MKKKIFKYFACMITVAILATTLAAVMGEL